jgi:glycogen synthase
MMLPWPVYAAGETYDLSSNHREASNVRLLGRLQHDDLDRWFQAAAIYALPAKYEPFGLSILEAALSRCALVLGDIPSLRETWDGAACFVFPDDHRQLTEALKRLVQETDTRLSLAQRGFSRALDFTAERMANGYRRVYRELLE